MSAFKQLIAESAIGVLVRRLDKATQRLLDQRATRSAHHIGSRQIGLQYQAFGTDRAIAYRRQIVEVKIALALDVKRKPLLAQFFVLPLQFDLVQMQFVKRLLCRSRPQEFCLFFWPYLFLPFNGLCAPPQRLTFRRRSAIQAPTPAEWVRRSESISVPFAGHIFSLAAMVPWRLTAELNRYSGSIASLLRFVAA